MLRRYTYVQCVERAVGGAESILDVGCGGNSPIGRFDDRPRFSVGIDLFEPAIEESRLKRIHDEYRLMNVLDIHHEFEHRSFDVVLACDLLEHLEAEAGLLLLRKMEGIARRRVVILTPNGFLPQDERSNNPLQEHRSGWTPAQMRNLGYEVLGVNGLRFLRGELGLVRWRPRRIWSCVSDVSRPVVFHRPEWAFHMLCVKYVDPN